MSIPKYFHYHIDIFFILQPVEDKETAEDVLDITAAEEQENSPHLDSTGSRAEEELQLQNCSSQVEEEPQMAEEKLLEEESGEEVTKVQVAEEKFLEEESEEEVTKVQVAEEKFLEEESE